MNELRGSGRTHRMMEGAVVAALEHQWAVVIMAGYFQVHDVLSVLRNIVGDDFVYKKHQRTIELSTGHKIKLFTYTEYSEGAAKGFDSGIPVFRDHYALSTELEADK